MEKNTIHIGEENLNQKAKSLIHQQIENWPLAGNNYLELEKIESKAFHFDGFQIIIQFNPERIRSSAAKLDAQSLSNRACFLCKINRPKEQVGVDFYGKYIILINPYPIFREHLTIALHAHSPQEIEPYFADMLQLSKELPDFIIFYNGPKCGASAPDHFHFQAAGKNGMPVELEIDFILKRFGQLLFRDKKTTIQAIGKDYLRNLIVLTSTSEAELVRHFELILSILKERGQKGEPMMNILVSYKNGGWQIILFPRDKQRPSHFFEEGDMQILMSPASAEMGGLSILPRREDFDKITKEDLVTIYRQVTVNEDDFEKLKMKLTSRI